MCMFLNIGLQLFFREYSYGNTIILVPRGAKHCYALFLSNPYFATLVGRFPPSARLHNMKYYHPTVTVLEF